MILYIKCAIVFSGEVECSASGDRNINCIWGGGSCFFSPNENGEYSWVKIQYNCKFKRCQYKTKCFMTFLFILVSEYNHFSAYNLRMPSIGAHTFGDMLFRQKMSSVW